MYVFLYVYITQSKRLSKYAINYVLINIRYYTYRQSLNKKSNLLLITYNHNFHA